MGVEAIVAVISAVAAAASAAGGIYSATKGSPKMPGPPTVSKGDLAAQGAMRPELFNSNTPAFKANLAGAPTGPLPGAGSITTGSIGGAADDFSSILSKAGGKSSSVAGGGLESL